MKVHPQTDAIPLTDLRYLPYIELCRDFHLPFVSHTEQDSFCSKEMLAELAEKNPDVDFVAVHMGLHSDYSNLYGDTTFVPADIAAKVVETSRAEKILFGTDAPVMGVRNYDFFPFMAKTLENRFGADAADTIFCKNCKRLLLNPA